MRLSFNISVSGTCSPSRDDETYLVNATSGPLSRTLPDATLCRGARRTISKTDSSANAVTINTTSSQTITTVGGAVTSVTLSAQGNSYTVECDGAGWHVIAKI